MGEFGAIFSGLMLEDKPKKEKGMKWIRLGIDNVVTQEEKKAQAYKSLLRKKGIEVRKLPFQLSENIVFIRRKDLPQVGKILSRKNLKRMGI